jgi:hypothetical protein
MNESIPTTWNNERDTPFFGITAKLAAGLADDTALLTNVLAGNDLTEHIQKVLDDVIAAESWESMAMRAIARSAPGDRDLVPVPVIAPRRSA